MPVYVNSIAAAGQETNSSIFGKGLGKDDFLKLLVAQLQNQDPMNPMSNTEFIAQMAQFSALEQMYNLNNSFRLLQQDLQGTMMLQAVSLIGKEVTAVLNDQTIAGTVEKVNWTAYGAVLTVEGQQLPIGAVVEIALPEPAPEEQITVVEPLGAATDFADPAEGAGVSFAAD